MNDAGANVLHYSDGKEVLELFKKNKIVEYDLIITDINMKRLGEIEKQNQNNQYFSHRIPIIAISGASDRKNIFKILSSCIDDFLVKGKYDSGDIVELSKFWIDKTKLQKFNLN